MLIDVERSRVATQVVASRPRVFHRPRWRWIFVFLPAVALAVFGEMQTSWLESHLFARVARNSSFSVEPGPAAHFRHPHSGPYDIRLGHSLLTGFEKRLASAGYAVDSQARMSPEMAWLADYGFYPAYREKTRAGLQITDRFGHPLYTARYPERTYRGFDDIPPLVVRALLFIENRKALDDNHPYRNPAVEWNRLASAVIDYGIAKIRPSHGVAGGSTLATQLEKLRHSPSGRTHSVNEKFRQMLSASARAYLDGRDTRDSRRRIITTYLNSLPLAAITGYGEVYGLGDGLWAWYGADFQAENRALESPEDSERKALAFRRALSLLLAIKKPTTFLVSDRASLDRRVNSYLDLLSRAGVISPKLRELARLARPRLRDRADVPRQGSYSRRKATDTIRAELLGMLDLPSVYDLDRLDLSVESTLDGPAQQAVNRFLEQIERPDGAASAGLKQHRLLETGDPAGVIYSVSLYERGHGANLLRVQADNLDQPLNINEGTKLELGSTAKLRTLVSYLQTVVALRGKLSRLDADQLAALPVAAGDHLTAWARDWIASHPAAGLDTMLEAAMLRTYSGNPNEAFFTGGGVHRFSNFSSSDNGRILTVREAFRRSVNLVFVRLMRDLVNYHIYRLDGVTPDILSNPNQPKRAEYLRRYAAREGRQLITRYFQRYEGLKADQALQVLVSGMKHKTPRRLAAVYRYIQPGDGLDGFAAFLIGNTLDPDLSDKLLRELYAASAPHRFSLADRAYIAGLDPLELWLVRYKLSHPAAGLGEVFRESGPVCQRAYGWLFQARHRRAQNRAIRIMLEVDAFRALHQEWKRQGYPFASLVPSLATALGSSGDTPAALSDLVGIIVNHGIYYPGVRVERLHFARNTPFETNFTFRGQGGHRVMAPEVARLIERELVGVVEEGTGRRARGAMLLGDGASISVGGKTGTGDNRFETYGSGGRVIASRVINRTATFVFTIGERYFGTITAFVPGEAAAAYHFTSSLPVQIFRDLAPAFSAMIEDARVTPSSPAPSPAA